MKKGIQIAFGGLCLLLWGAWGVLSHSQDVVDAELQRLFLAADLNHDGTLEKQELDQVLAFKMKLLDLNGDGYISLEEQSVVDEKCKQRETSLHQEEGCRRSVKKEIERIVAMMCVEDVNHDGRITLAEFQGSDFIQRTKTAQSLLSSKISSASPLQSRNRNREANAL